LPLVFFSPCEPERRGCVIRLSVGPVSYTRTTGLPTINLTGELPGRFKLAFILFPTVIVLSALLIIFSIIFSLGSPWFNILAWFVGIYCGFISLIFMFIMWQALSYRNPVLQLTEDGLLFYGARIPWRAIRSTYVGAANFYVIAAGREGALLPQDRLWIEIENREQLHTPAPSKRFMYHLARVLLRRSGGKLLLPLVKERTVEGLALDIRVRISETPWDTAT
jgi:hypothetical protein